MRKFTLAFSIATASLMVTACDPPAKAPEAETTTLDTTEAAAPAADGNAIDAKMAGSGEASNSATDDKDDDKGGDPGARQPASPNSSMP